MATVAMFTRAEVAKCTEKERPLIILFNKVYDVAKWLPFHPGGDEVLLFTAAGTDATKYYITIGHSEPALKKREEFCVGELIPSEHTEWTAEMNKNASSASHGPTKVIRLASMAAIALYVAKAVSSPSEIPKQSYSAALRHAHLLMALGVTGSLGSVFMATRSEGKVKKNWLDLHKSLGVMMAVGLLLRVWARMQSVIPQRPLSTKAGHVTAYALLSLSCVTGLAYSYMSGAGVPAPFPFNMSNIAANKDPTDQDMLAAKNAIDTHRLIGRVFVLGFLSLHLLEAGLKGSVEAVVRSISPFL